MSLRDQAGASAASQQDESQIDLTPMLDVVFIMLIFFIVTTSFVKEAGIEVNKPKAANLNSTISLRAKKKPIKNGICASIGRHPPSGFAPSFL